jgi:hypothetical protein
MREIGRKGDKRSLKTMTPEKRSARAKKAAMAAAKKRTAVRLRTEVRPATEKQKVGVVGQREVPAPGVRLGRRSDGCRSNARFPGKSFFYQLTEGK